MNNRKYAKIALKVFAALRGTDEDFDQAEEAAELVRALTTPFVIPTSDDLEPEAA